MPLFGPSIITRADRAMRSGRWETAACLYAKALKRNPNKPPIWIQYGHALRAMGQLNEAERAYGIAIIQDPTNDDARAQLQSLLNQKEAQPHTRRETGGRLSDLEANIIDEEIFRRDLHEVYLLMDFISSLPGKSLKDLVIPDPKWQPTSNNERRPEMDATQAIAEIAKVRFPPQGTAQVIAENAALLLEAKDRLNELARPARGRTIAYTTMFAGGEGAFWSLIDRIISTFRQANRAPTDSSRLDLAQAVIPELIYNVRRFKLIFNVLIVAVFVWLAFTALTYWDIALGGAILQRLDQLEHDKATILQANPALFDCNKEGSANPTDASTRVSCLQLQTIAGEQEKAIDDLVRYRRCRGVKWYLFLRCWPGSNFVARSAGAEQLMPQPPDENQDRGQSTAEGKSSTAERTSAHSGDQSTARQKPQRLTIASTHEFSQTIASVLLVFSIYVVPMMFGILGTLVAMIRAMHDKIRDNLLAPRDLVLMLTSLPIGAIAGLAVGLFFSTSAAAVPGSSGLTGSLSLSAGGLAFLAGYAADAFFSFLDSIRGQVFAATNPPVGVRAPPSLTTQTPPPTRPAVAPSTAGPVSPAEVTPRTAVKDTLSSFTITGSGLAGVTQVEAMPAAGGNPVLATIVGQPINTQVQCTLTLPAGTWSVRVSSGTSASVGVPGSIIVI
jgi:tetratricopeptide (TPR) repeat protein